MLDLLKRFYFFVSDFLVTLAIAGAIFVFVYFTLLRPYQVKGKSMVPNFVNNEYVLTDVLTRHFSQFERGTVVVFDSPVDDDKDFIKRIIGLPGEKVKIENGKVYVNGQLLDESRYLPNDFVTNPGAFLKESVEMTVPKNSYFVLGDNRSFSSDSREWGFVNKQFIIGRSLLVYWPLNSIRVVNKVDYVNDPEELFN